METVLSILVLAGIALLIGALVAWRRGLRKQAGLMLMLAVVVAVNVGIWTLPDATGAAPVTRELK